MVEGQWIDLRKIDLTVVTWGVSVATLRHWASGPVSFVESGMLGQPGPGGRAWSGLALQVVCDLVWEKW